MNKARKVWWSLTLNGERGQLAPAVRVSIKGAVRRFGFDDGSVLEDNGYGYKVIKVKKLEEAVKRFGAPRPFCCAEYSFIKGECPVHAPKSINTAIFAEGFDCLGRPIGACCESKAMLERRVEALQSLLDERDEEIDQLKNDTMPSFTWSATIAMLIFAAFCAYIAFR